MRNQDVIGWLVFSLSHRTTVQAVYLSNDCATRSIILTYHQIPLRESTKQNTCKVFDLILQCAAVISKSHSCKTYLSEIKILKIWRFILHSKTGVHYYVTRYRYFWSDDHPVKERARNRYSYAAWRPLRSYASCDCNSHSDWGRRREATKLSFTQLQSTVLFPIPGL